jgi:hypothetical protein
MFGSYSISKRSKIKVPHCKHKKNVGLGGPQTVTEICCEMLAVWRVLDEYEALAEKPTKVLVGKPANALIYPQSCAHGVHGIEPGLYGQGRELNIANIRGFPSNVSAYRSFQCLYVNTSWTDTLLNCDRRLTLDIVSNKQLIH